MRFLLPILIVLCASACGSVEYKDTNAEVDKRAECVGSEGRPGEAVSPWCKREQSAEWSSGKKSEKIDLSGAKKDD